MMEKSICQECGKPFKITRQKEIMSHLLPFPVKELFMQCCSLECGAWELPVNDDLLGEPEKKEEEDDRRTNQNTDGCI